MGKIMEFFRKKVKDEQKKLEKKYHGQYTKKELLEKAANSVLKKAILTGGITVSCIVAGVSGYCALTKDKETINGGENKVIEETTKLVGNDNLTNESDNLSKIDQISSRSDALEYIKDIYLDEYNKSNNTNYTLDEIEFNTSNENYVFDLDGIYVTHGATPDSVKNRLDKENQAYDIKNNVRIYSTYLVENGNKNELESFAVTENMIVNVILGDKYVQGKDINIDEINTLIEMYGPITTGIDLVLDYSNGKSESNISIRKEMLKNSIKRYEEEHSEKNREVEEIGG